MTDETITFRARETEDARTRKLNDLAGRVAALGTGDCVADGGASDTDLSEGGFLVIDLGGSA